jgi:hypothetical protein
MPFLKHEHFASRTREICRVHKAVVAAADYDRIELSWHGEKPRDDSSAPGSFEAVTFYRPLRFAPTKKRSQADLWSRRWRDNK